MRTEQQYLWKVLWNGKWTTTSYHCSEDNIRVLHPEAVCVPTSLIERNIPETEEEYTQRFWEISTCQTHPDRKDAETRRPDIDPDIVPF